MKILNNCVLLLKAEKSEESEDKYESILTESGFMVKHIKTLEFYYKDLDQLKNKILNPHNYDGLIFTTPRSVQALQKSLCDDILPPIWKNKFNYVVGEATYQKVLKECDLDCTGKESGNAKNLLDVILHDKNKIIKPLLFPCGNLKTDTLIDGLSEEDIQVETVTVYETRPSSHIGEDFKNVTSNYADIPEYFVYFSPSGVEFTFDYITHLNIVSHLVKFIAIGPTTEAALRNKCLNVKSVALKPTPHDLLNAVIS